jgi:hypothetical protein
VHFITRLKHSPAVRLRKYGADRMEVLVAPEQAESVWRARELAGGLLISMRMPRFLKGKAGTCLLDGGTTRAGSPVTSLRGM